jgi:hypothetical protein
MPARRTVTGTIIIIRIIRSTMIGIGAADDISAWGLGITGGPGRNGPPRK